MNKLCASLQLLLKMFAINERMFSVIYTKEKVECICCVVDGITASTQNTFNIF